MSYRISPVWWPILAIASPVIFPRLLIANRRFKADRARAASLNQVRIKQALPLEVPELDSLELTVLVEWKTEAGFVGDPGVSYLFKSDLGSILYDVGFGPERPSLAHNAAKLGFHLDQVDALAISHLHLDHMGGRSAWRIRQVRVPGDLMPSKPKPCFLPDKAEAEGFKAEVVECPRLLAAGIASTGPLARSLFLGGLVEEQALLARVKGKGLVVFTGCGHPSIEVVLQMVKRLSNEPLYALGGGLHFPVTDGRWKPAGIQIQMLYGTGKPPWQRITDEDLSQAITTLNTAGLRRFLPSGHDTCDHALDRMTRELEAKTEVLQAGATYRF